MIKNYDVHTVITPQWLNVSSVSHWSVPMHCVVIRYDDVIMCTIASQITSLTAIYSTVYSGADQSKHQSSASLAFVWGIHRGPVNSPHKWPVTRKMFPFDDVIMQIHCLSTYRLWHRRAGCRATAERIGDVYIVNDDVITDGNVRHSIHTHSVSKLAEMGTIECNLHGGNHK